MPAISIAPYTLKSLLMSLLDPWLFLLFALSHIPRTVGHLWRARDFRTLFSTSGFKDAWFGEFWEIVGPGIREHNWSRITALIDGRVRDGRVLEHERAATPICGTVIEVGAGSGMWAGLFTESALRSDGGGDTTKDGVHKRKRDEMESSNRITKVLGVEPNADMHPKLHNSICAAGLGEVYEIIPVGIEDLISSGRAAEESVDCILSILCLCSIPDPGRNINELYSCLKPGGRWYVFEHVECVPSQGWLMRVYQGMYTLGPGQCLCHGRCNSV